MKTRFTVNKSVERLPGTVSHFVKYNRNDLASTRAGRRSSRVRKSEREARSSKILPFTQFYDSETDEEVYLVNLLNDQAVQHFSLSKDCIESDEVRTTRKEILKWIYHYGTLYDQAEETIQTAMIYVDKLIKAGKFTQLRLRKEKWAATCLFCASKMSEVDHKVIATYDLESKCILILKPF